jgi:hypothetical protein
MGPFRTEQHLNKMNALSQIFSLFITGVCVVETGGQPFLPKISANFRKNFEMASMHAMGYSGARGK